MALVRTTVTLPEELLRHIDELAGPRGRSSYVLEAVAQRVKRDRLGKALRETAGAMIGKPGHMTPEEVLALVRQLRSEDRDPWAGVSADAPTADAPVSADAPKRTKKQARRARAATAGSR